MKYVPLSVSIVVTGVLAYLATTNEWSAAIGATWVLFVFLSAAAAMLALATDAKKSNP